MVKAAIILHNPSILHGSKEELDWDIATSLYKKRSRNILTNNGSDVREALVNYFSLNPL